LAEISAVCVAGSSARGDADHDSDIDLLAIVDDREAASRVRQSIAPDRLVGSRRVQLKLLSEAGLDRMFERRSTYAVHVLREGVVAYDPSDMMRRLLENHSAVEPVRNNRRDLLDRLEAYTDLDWCQGFYLYCLSDLYSIGRAAVFTMLGRESRFEFSASRAFDALAEGNPRLAAQTARVARLRPFFLLAQRDHDVELPFPYRNSHMETRDARNACRRVVEAIR